MTKVKICGVTRVEDAALAAALGADFLGLMFVKDSPRYVEPERTAPLRSAARGAGAPSLVGVFRDESIDEVLRIAEIAQLDLIQLHGSEDDEYVSAMSLPVIQAIKVGTALPQTTSTAQWIMFDTGGGTGRRFDWSLLAGYHRHKPFFLAGGLTPDNVADAIRETRPDAVDVSSGVESAPGLKDHQKMRDFFERVRQT